MSKMGNQLTIITLGMILLGGTILGSTPFAFADEDDDKKEKLKDLLAKIKAKIEAKKPPPGDRGDKCKGTFYGEICDDSPPSVGIKFPAHRDRLPADTYIVVVKAKDGQTAVDMVEVFVNGVSIGKASFVGGELYETLPHDFTEKGRYTIKAIATDLVGNEGSDKIRFRIV